MKRIVVALALMLAISAAAGAWYFLAGPGATISAEAIRQNYGPQYAAKREQLKRIAAALPPAGSIAGDPAPLTLDPQPRYDVRVPEFNTEIVMFEQLGDPDLLARGLDLGLSGGLLLFLNDFARNLDGRYTRQDAARFGTAIGHRYLVVLRPVRYVPPKAVGSAAYSRGVADLEAFVVDLSDDAVKLSFLVKAETADSTFGPGSDIAAAAVATLIRDARHKLEAALARFTAGKFEFDRSD